MPPPGLAAGVYKGMIEVNTGSLVPVELWLEVRVFDFDLPGVPALKTDFGLLLDTALAASKSKGYAGAPAALAERYLASAFEHRVTLRSLTRLPLESADYAAELDAFAARRKDVKQAAASSIAVSPTLLDVPEQLAQADAFVKEQGLANRTFCPMALEPEPASWPRLLEHMQRWKDAAPNIPLMVTAMGLEPFIPDVLDIWCVHLPVLDTPNNKTVLEGVRAGHEAWTYVNHNPPRPYGNFFIDFAAVEHRVLFWQTWALGFRGMHYWCVNAYGEGQDPWTDQLDITPANGNGSLVYPGPEGPVSSIRWETIRDGIEDYDYLALLSERMRELKAKGGHSGLAERAEAAANLQALVPDLVTFTRESAVLEAKRKEIGETIEALGRVLPDGNR